MECSGHQITFQFQLGLIRDRVTVDSNELNLKSLKSLACDFICDKLPQNGVTRLQERILLFRHDYSSSNILQVIMMNYSINMKCMVSRKINEHFQFCHFSPNFAILFIIIRKFYTSSSVLFYLIDCEFRSDSTSTIL